MNKAGSFILFLTGCLLSSILYAQPISSKFGKIEEEYIKMKAYEPDTSAEAAVLFNKGRVYFQFTAGEIKLVHVYHKRIKILRSSGESYANVSIPYFAYNSQETIGDIKGMTHYVDDNGKVIQQKMEKKAIIDEDIDGRYHYKKFTLPNAREGAIIEYTYKIYSESWASTRNWYFQSNLPTAYSEYTTRLPKDFDFRHLTLGEQYNLDRKVGNSTLAGSSLQETVTTYTARDIPALVEEPYVTSISNYYFRLELQLRGIHIPGVVSQNYIKSWNQLGSETIEDESFASLIKGNNKLKAELALVLAKAEDDPKAQVASIYHWVQQHFASDGSMSRWPNKKLNDLIKEQKGNGASINVLLVGMLRQAGFNAFPMLVCTRSNGIPQSIFPTLRQFNHTIAYVVIGEEGIPLDATYNLTAYNMLPIQDLNHQGMVISENGAQWISIAPKHAYKTNVQTILKLTDDGMLNGTIKSTDNGYAAYGGRAELFQADDKQAYIKDQLVDGFIDVEVLTQKVESDSLIEKPLVSSCELETSDYVNASGDYIYLQPMLNQAVKENPFKLETRTYPVDFAYPRQYKFSLSLQIPPGYVIEETPKPARVSLPNRDGEFLYHVAVMGNMLQMVSDIKINKTVFDSQTYPYIREFYDMIVAKHAEQLVLKKQDVETGGGNK